MAGRKIKMAWWIFLMIIFSLIVTFQLFKKSATQISAEIKIDSLVVLKSERKLMAFNQGKLLNTYQISLGKSPSGPKQIQGDNKTPEGNYLINDKNDKSFYHKNIGINYPNANDKARANDLGSNPGGDIKIHGLPNRYGWIGSWHIWFDWTAGCIAVTNQEMDEIYEKTSIGTPITILK